MIKTSWSNTFTWGYNGVPLALRESPFDKLSAHYTQSARQPMGFRGECINTARIIASDYGIDNVAVLYSGGADSEAVLTSFLSDGLRPHVFFCDTGFNSYDKAHVERYAAYWSLNLTTLNYTREWWDSDTCMETLVKYQSPEAALGVHLHAIETVSRDYYAVVGEEFDYEFRNGEWHMACKEYAYSMWKPFIVNKRDGCPMFFAHTPEQIIAHLEHPTMAWLRNQTNVKFSSQVKPQTYRAALSIPVREKRTGGESLLNVHAALNQRLKRRPECGSDDLAIKVSEVLCKLK